MKSIEILILLIVINTNMFSKLNMSWIWKKKNKYWD